MEGCKIQTHYGLCSVWGKKKYITMHGSLNVKYVNFHHVEQCLTYNRLMLVRSVNK